MYATFPRKKNYASVSKRTNLVTLREWKVDVVLPLDAASIIGVNETLRRELTIVFLNDKIYKVGFNNS